MSSSAFLMRAEKETHFEGFVEWNSVCADWQQSNETAAKLLLLGEREREREERERERTSRDQVVFVTRAWLTTQTGFAPEQEQQHIKSDSAQRGHGHLDRFLATTISNCTAAAMNDFCQSEPNQLHNGADELRSDVQNLYLFCKEGAETILYVHTHTPPPFISTWKRARMYDPSLLLLLMLFVRCAFTCLPPTSIDACLQQLLSCCLFSSLFLLLAS